MSLWHPLPWVTSFVPEPGQTSGLVQKVLLEHLNLALECGGNILESWVAHWVPRVTSDLPCFLYIVYYQNDKGFLKTVQMDAAWYNKTWCARSWLWTIDDKEGSYLLAAGVHWRIWGQSLLRISAPPLSHLGKGYYYLQCLLLKHSRMLRWAKAWEMLCKFQNTMNWRY